MFDLNHNNFILHTIFQTISIQKIYNKFTKNHSTKIIGSTALNDICQLFWSHLHINTMYCIVNSCSYIEDHTTELILFVAAISFVLLELMFH
jgi:hypothetical protein